MTKFFRKLIYSLLLAKLVRERAPDVIPRSGDKGKAACGYIVIIRENDEDRGILVDKLESQGLVGRAWDDTVYVTEVGIPFANISQGQIKIDHYYGLRTYNYSSLGAYIFLGMTGIHRLGARFNLFQQFLFNARQLHRQERMNVLQHLVNLHIVTPDFRVSPITLMTLVHTVRWVDHPNRDIEISYNRLVLSSLEVTGDLKSDERGYYSVAGQALKSISDYEESERRHNEAVMQARALKWLTIVLVIIGAIQAWVAYTN